MAVGDKILSQDYNRIRNKAIAVLGTGGTNPSTNAVDPTFGYGQALASSSVAIGTKITKAQWDSLKLDISNSIVHQTNTVPNIVSVASNSKIQSTILAYEGFADTAVANRLSLGTNRSAIETGASRSRNFAWKNQSLCTVTVTFSNANQLRHFFNSGGQIRFSSSFDKIRTDAQNTAWENLLVSAGTQAFAVNRVYTLTNSYTTWYTKAASSPYGANNYQLQALCNVANNSTGTASQITFRAVWTDGYTDPDPSGGIQFAPDDGVSGTLSLTATQRRAVGSFQPSGTFSISSPSYTISGITGS